MLMFLKKILRYFGWKLVTVWLWSTQMNNLQHDLVNIFRIATVKVVKNTPY